jgi:hypothetical protein
MKDEKVGVTDRLSTHRVLAVDLEATLQAAVEAFEEVAHTQRAAGAVLGGKDAPIAERNARIAEAHGARARLLIDHVRLGAATRETEPIESFHGRLTRVVGVVDEWLRPQQVLARSLSLPDLQRLFEVALRAAESESRSTAESQRVVPALAPAPIATSAVRQ